VRIVQNNSCTGDIAFRARPSNVLRRARDQPRHLIVDLDLPAKHLITEERSVVEDRNIAQARRDIQNLRGLQTFQEPKGLLIVAHVIETVVLRQGAIEREHLSSWRSLS
jgi:hypothetical protein